MEKTAVLYADEVLGTILDAEKYERLTADQLRDAINNYGRVVVRAPDGSYDMFNPESSDYEYRAMVNGALVGPTYDNLADLGGSRSDQKIECADG